MLKLGETDLVISKIESWSGKLGVTDHIFSVGPKILQ